MDTKLRIVGYARVSTQRQAVEGFNLDGQIRQIKNYVDIYYENYDLTILREDGYSARTMERPQMTKIISMVKQHQLDVLVIYTYDRLTRRLKDFIDFLELLEENGVTLDSMREKFDTSTASGRFMAHMITAMAEWEEDTISERTLRGLKEAVLKGKYIRGGQPPFGYIRDPHDKHKLLLKQSEADTVYEIFQAAIDHIPLLAIAKEFEAEKRNGYSNWTSDRIYKIIQNKVYFGIITVDGIDYPVDVPKIITEEQYIQANNFRRNRGTYNSHDYLFKNFMFCSKCGSLLVTSGTAKKSSGTYYRYYRCPHCKRIISEKKALEQIEDKMTERARILQLDLFYQRYKKIDDRYAQALRWLSVDDLVELPKEYIAEKSKELMIKESELTNELKNVCRNIKLISFSRMSFHEQRAFLSENVRILHVDFRLDPPLVTIIWKDEEEIAATKRRKKTAAAH